MHSDILNGYQLLCNTHMKILIPNLSSRCGIFLKRQCLYTVTFRTPQSQSLPLRQPNGCTSLLSLTVQESLAWPALNYPSADLSTWKPPTSCVTSLSPIEMAQSRSFTDRAIRSAVSLLFYSNKIKVYNIDTFNTHLCGQPSVISIYWPCKGPSAYDKSNYNKNINSFNLQ